MHQRLLISWIVLLLLLLTGCREPLPEITLQDKVGQLIMVGFRGLEVDRNDRTFADMKRYNIGGVILYDIDEITDYPLRNIYSRFQLKALTDSLNNLTKTPMFIAINQEGGRMSPLKPQHGFPRSLTAAHIGRVNHADSTKNYAIITSKSLQAAGINTNFAPIVDINTNPGNLMIGRLDRSYSANAGVVSQNAEIVSDVLRSYNIIPVYKHFPGHGSDWNTFHLGMSDLTSTWSPDELRPYRLAMQKRKLDAVMTGNLFQFDLDVEYPATFSSSMINDILRQDIGFRGVVFTGDLHTEAIRRYYPFDEAIKLAINAGADVLVYSNNAVRYEPDIIERVVKTILELVELGEIDKKRIDESYERVLALKRKYGILE